MPIRAHATLLTAALAAPLVHGQPFSPVDDRTTTPQPLGPNTAASAAGPAGVLLALRSKNEGYEPWFLPAGSTTARLVADIKPGPGDGFYPTNQPTYIRTLGDRFVFSAANAFGRLNLWTTSGAPGDATQLADLWADNDAEPRESALLGGRLVLLTQQGAWITDGTPGGTRRLARVQSASQLVASGPHAYFTALDARGNEVWVTDGTPEGTHLLRDITPEYSTTGPVYLSPWNGDVYFMAADHAGQPQDGLWRSDGTEAGTRKLAHIGVSPVTPRGFVPLGDLLYFAGSTPSGLGCLYATDGTTAGTRVSIPEIRIAQMHGVGDRLLIFARYPSTGWYMILSGGTEESNEYLAEIAESSAPWTIQRQGGRALFTVSTLADGWSTYTTDGTSQGTRRLAPPATPLGRFMNATLMPGWLLLQYEKTGTNDTYPFRYSEDDGSLTPITGFEQQDQAPTAFGPMATSGATLAVLSDSTVRTTTGGPTTPIATFSAADLAPSTRFLAFAGPDLLLGAAGLWRLDQAGPTRLDGPANPAQPAADAGRLFFAADGLGGGVEPWVYAGGAAQRLGDLSATSSNPVAFTRAGPLVYFHAANTFGRELWATEGTPQTTRRISDLSPAGGSGVWSGATASPLGAGMGPLGDRIVFPGATSGQNYEPWSSRGADPSLIAELTPGTAGSFPTAFTPVASPGGAVLYFMANGRLYRLREAGAPEPVFQPPGSTAIRAITATGGSLFILNGPRQGSSEAPAPCTLWAILDPAFPPALVAEVSASGSSERPSSLLTALGETGWVALPADTLATGQELMLSRGVGAELGGTRIVELAPGPWSSNITLLAATSDALYAVGTDGPHGVELYRASLADLGITPPCATDFNRDGFTDFFDYDDFVRCFEGGVCPPARTADFNHDGFADFFDYGDFVAAFEAGC